MDILIDMRFSHSLMMHVSRNRIDIFLFTDNALIAAILDVHAGCFFRLSLLFD